MKLARAQRTLRSRLAYLKAKLDAGFTQTVQAEHDALDLALRMLKWRDDVDVEIEVASQRAAERVLPIERRTVARAQRGDRLREDVGDLVARLQRAVHGRSAA